LTSESTLNKKRLDKPIGLEYRIDESERNIVNSLSMLGIIGSSFSGSVTIHFCEGGISDYEKSEKGLRKRINLKG
jgi:hypothetical protein